VAQAWVRSVNRLLQPAAKRGVICAVVMAVVAAIPANIVIAEVGGGGSLYYAADADWSIYAEVPPHRTSLGDAG
jgi:hypothetical protein